MSQSCSTIAVRVTPGAKDTALERLAEGGWKIRLRARAVEGQANTAVLAQFADWLDVPKSHVRLLRGQTGRQKVLEISGLSSEEITGRLQRFAGTF